MSVFPAAAAGAVDAAGPLPAVLFYMFAGVTAAGAIGVALSGNIVRAAVGLLFALAGMSGIYLLLNAEFIAAVQLVVYVGGTLILIVFGVMLTSKSPAAAYRPKTWEVVWATVVMLMLATPLGIMLVTHEMPGPAAAHAGTQPTTYPMTTLGRALLEPTGYLVPFELVSVLLLAVMIGAAYLAKGRRPKRDNAAPAMGAAK